MNHSGVSVIKKEISWHRNPYNNINLLGELIRDSIFQAYPKSKEKNEKNPFSKIIKPGSKVLLNPNWCSHKNPTGKGMDCVITNENFILAVLEEVCKNNPGHVLIADAPMQWVVWDKLFSGDFIEKTKLISEKYGVPVKIKDLRRTKTSETLDELHQNEQPLESCQLFDLGKRSCLELITIRKNQFRLIENTKKVLQKAHYPGVHKYFMIKELFDYDVILSLPKLKTHQKTGITAALKNSVGFNGNKEYLPHHRYGGTGRGGDCYPGDPWQLRYAEKIMDWTLELVGTKWYKPLRFLARILKHNYEKEHPDSNLAGAWYGNDTCWRMVTDLNMIIKYGKKDGTVSENVQRKIYTISDTIIGGQGNCPVYCYPIRYGAVVFSDSSLQADYIHAALMKFDSEKINLLKKAGKYIKEEAPDLVSVNNKKITLEEFSNEYGKETTPPPGWIEYLRKG